MALTQTRTYELDVYVQLNTGDPGYINPDELMFLVDHSTWDEPKRMPSSNFGESGSFTHIEKNTLTELSNRNVSVTFNTAFSVAPVGWIKVYRMEQMPSGVWQEQDVVWGYATSTKVSTTGFSIQINASESLTGIIIEYEFK